jgi:hypothetical protein
MKVGHRERLKVGTNDFDQIKGLTDLRVQRNMISKCPGFDGLLRSGGRTRTYSDEAASESVKLGLEADDGGKRREVTWQTPPAVPLVRSLTDWETISKLNNVYLREEGMSWLGERMTGQANLEFSSQPHQPLFLLQPTRTTDGPCLSFYHHPSTPMRERRDRQGRERRGPARSAAQVGIVQEEPHLSTARDQKYVLFIISSSS